MHNLSQFLLCGLIIPHPVVGFDSNHSLCDDPPSLNKLFLVKVEARFEGVADVHSDIPQLDGCDGLTESLRRLRGAAGSSDAFCSERLSLKTHIHATSPGLREIRF